MDKQESSHLRLFTTAFLSCAVIIIALWFPAILRSSSLRQGPINGPGDTLTGPRNPLNGPTDPVNGPRDSLNSPRDPFIGPRDPLNGLREPLNGPTDLLNGPRDPFNGLRNTVNDRIDSLSDPADAFNGPKDPIQGADPYQSDARSITKITPLTAEERRECYKSCRIELVESLPENLTLPSVSRPIGSTYHSWKRLISLAETRITMAAYKSSFRGRHVLSDEHLYCAQQGDHIYDQLKMAAIRRGIRLEAVENYPAKDRGDNEDASALAKLGVLERRRLDMSRISSSGIMHSKFLLVDDQHFYLGSANFDWRSLNQKMELGVHVESCPCLAGDLRTIYDSYWASTIEASDEQTGMDLEPYSSLPVLTSRMDPLVVRVNDVDTEVYLAASPKKLSATARDWDLDAIIDIIDHATDRLDINVMDYVPMYVYEKPRRFWPVIENAIRKSVIERGVNVRFLTAALHFTSESLLALKSLQALNTSPSIDGKVDVKILNVPAVTPSQRMFARERRTHRKYVITDDTMLIGTSNWSGDYFANTTGLAIVMRQAGGTKIGEKRKTGNETKSSERRDETERRKEREKRPLITQARQLFERDWNSMYATDLDVYMKHCYDKETGRDVCKVGRMAYQQDSSLS